MAGTYEKLILDTLQEQGEIVSLLNFCLENNLRYEWCWFVVKNLYERGTIDLNIKAVKSHPMHIVLPSFSTKRGDA
ncbi:MAG TPA: hypothetical protein PKW33_15485 [Anaerolineaceae bacterium]|nr:hypothetical protein [Anaerolineaceae bacterium]HPN52997.1 hypothetical protein [Anaerolineaceae bacterium]